ncbi:hypothetical protein HK104_000540 [Borealophlyctis nickersoniae]|nr:hypothetical protein HK104_000540 [Borealophlyctis nickersoniae]
MAEKDGKLLNVHYVRGVVADEGFSILGKNMLPLLFANALGGALLFNVYGLAIDRLTVPGFELHHPFLAGGIAGASTALVATPLDTIRSRTDPAQLVEHRHEGMLRFTYRTVKQALPAGTWEKVRVLYSGLPYTAMKDGLGFGMFFGVFEGLRKTGKGLVADWWGLRDGGHGHDTSSPALPSLSSTATTPSSLPTSSSQQQQPRHPISLTLTNATAVILAGAMAGTAYQLVIYPLDNIPAVVAATRLTTIMDPVSAQAVAAAAAPSYADGFTNNNTKPGQARVSVKEVWSIVRKQGVKPFYKGIAPQLVRVMPPSAVGLFAYEVASSQFWDIDEG